MQYRLYRVLVETSWTSVHNDYTIIIMLYTRMHRSYTILFLQPALKQMEEDMWGDYCSYNEGLYIYETSKLMEHIQVLRLIYKCLVTIATVCMKQCVQKGEIEFS